MNIYGVDIDSDLAFPLDLPHDLKSGRRLRLSSMLPDDLRQDITCGFPLFAAHGRKVYLYSDRVFEGNQIGQPWCYEIKDVARFYWRSGDENLYYEMARKSDTHLLSFWFVHLVLPLYLTLEGVYDFLHAGCVDLDGVVTLFVAPSMGGKSTMTDFCLKQGHALVSDDKVPTIVNDGQFLVGGSHPYHRPYRSFEELGYHVDRFSPGFQPIGVFYALESGDVKRGPHIAEVRGAAKFAILHKNYLYTFPFLEKQRLYALAAMLNSVHLFKVRVPWSLDALPDVYLRIYSHSRRFA